MKEEGWVLNLNQLQHFIEVISKSILKDGKSFQIMEICDSNKNMLWWIVMIILSFLTRWSLSIGSSVWDLPVWLIRQGSHLQGSYQYLFTMLSVTHKSMAVCKTAVSPLLMHGGYHSLAILYRNDHFIVIIFLCSPCLLMVFFDCRNFQ